MATNARDVARRVLARVDEGAFTTLALGGELDRAGLAPPDRALATELAYGVLRWRRRLDAVLGAYTPRGLGGVDKHTLNTLRMAAFELTRLGTPAHAAVDQAVDAIRGGRTQKLAGFANALLRRLAREGEPASALANLADRASAPDWLVTRAQAALGDGAEAFLLALNSPAPIWMRVNRRRATVEEVRQKLLAQHPDATFGTDPRAPFALRLPSLGDPTRLDAWQLGLISIQDLAAQLVSSLATVKPNERVLDLCAGVGGKALDLAEGDARVTAVDLSERRLGLLADSAHRLGLDAKVTSIVADATALPLPADQRFDVVLVDAPCSGAGVLRRHPEAKWRAVPDAATNAKLQSSILAAAASRVAPGGRLIYAVCSFFPEEGQQQIDAFLAAAPNFKVDRILQTWPHSDDADAFFAALLSC